MRWLSESRQGRAVQMHRPSLRRYYVYKGALIPPGNGYSDIQRAVLLLLDKRNKGHAILI